MRDLFDRVYDGHKYDPVASRDRSKGGRGILCYCFIIVQNGISHPMILK